MTNYVYSFEEGKKELKNLLGGKGANLSEMTSLNIPVPFGFTISTEACAEYYNLDKKYPDELLQQIEDKLIELETKMGTKLGDNENPLLVSVRSGAAISMPGMMDTVLNLGLNDTSTQALAAKTNNERFAYDSYRRFINMFGNVVMNVEHKHFERVLTRIKADNDIKDDTKLTSQDLKKVVKEYKEVIQKQTNQMFPEDPREQLKMSVEAVFNSWNNPRAISYRRINNIQGLKGTAVNVQSMVFGNMGDTSGTGVCFTRDPSTGENKFYGEYLMNAQGEDVVAGIRTPLPISQLESTNHELYNQLVDIYKKLEFHYKDMQDIEFTIQESKLFILQTRSGKRTAHAAVKIAIDMEKEGLIDYKTAVLRVLPEQIDQLLHKQIDPEKRFKFSVIGKGLPASPGAAVGEVVFSAEKAKEHANKCDVILVRTETSPEDIEGMHVAKGILTSCGGMTSHAAVVARGMGTCCVSGCGDIHIDEEDRKFSVGDIVIREGDVITLDGSTGEIYQGEIPLIEPELGKDYQKLMKWADKIRTLKIRTNADSAHDATQARDFGAEGIGLCRTEHMFFEVDRIKCVREMILSNNVEERRKALEKILPMQKEDFIRIFRTMKGLPVTIRLLDPPLHEFLPTEDKEIQELSKAMSISVDLIKQKIAYLKEVNPMLGHRGVRLAITYPEIARMQIEAIIRAAAQIVKGGDNIVPEIMVPLVGHANELKFMKKLIDKTSIDIIKEENIELNYKVGTMIEVPRSAFVADKIAEYAQFFSFGTNDLTQLCLGYSRDDSGKFVPEYINQGILMEDPFQSVDIEGVGELMKLAIRKGKSTRESIKLGICGEHGGDPKTIELCHSLGLEYVSCSPYRVPIARLAAAHAVLKHNSN